MCGGISLTQSLPGRPSVSEGTKDSRPAGVFFLPPLFYNLGRVCSYTAIGAVLGAAGSIIVGNGTVSFPVPLQAILKMLAGIVMILAGIHMLGLFPFLRSIRIPVPRIFRRLSRIVLKKNRRPFIIGLLNGFMPCGPLQLMWVIALAAGSPFAGALSYTCWMGMIYGKILISG